ncbi:hypothetical protein D3C85_1523110 [compost metagenome]
MRSNAVFSTGAVLVRIRMVSVALENAVPPPFTVALPVPPLVPLVRSQARMVSASLTLPTTPALGRKYRRVTPSAANRRAVASVKLTTCVQLAPLLME